LLDFKLKLDARFAPGSALLLLLQTSRQRFRWLQATRQLGRDFCSAICLGVACTGRDTQVLLWEEAAQHPSRQTHRVRLQARAPVTRPLIH